MKHLHIWKRKGDFLIAWSNQYMGYAVWQKEPNWHLFNSVSCYFKTIEEADQFIEEI